MDWTEKYIAWAVLLYFAGVRDTIILWLAGMARANPNT
jgi:hypothetical protein